MSLNLPSGFVRRKFENLFLKKAKHFLSLRFVSTKNFIKRTARGADKAFLERAHKRGCLSSCVWCASRIHAPRMFSALWGYVENLKPMLIDCFLDYVIDMGIKETISDDH